MNTLHDYIELFLFAVVICFLILLLLIILFVIFVAVYFALKWLLIAAADAIHYYLTNDKEAA
ncbi:MAG TPA: hypothetical protein PLT92_13490 [Ignavibacteriaceae bacterium]|nr:hypothetical protein [Ignavibacteriaceae bacterium]